jgi:hypothetical protein
MPSFLDFSIYAGLRLSTPEYALLVFALHLVSAAPLPSVA